MQIHRLHPEGEPVGSASGIWVNVWVQVLGLWVSVFEGLEVIHHFGVALVLIGNGVVEVLVVVEVVGRGRELLVVVFRGVRVVELVWFLLLEAQLGVGLLVGVVFADFDYLELVLLLIRLMLLRVLFGDLGGYTLRGLLRRCLIRVRLVLNLTLRNHHHVLGRHRVLNINLLLLLGRVWLPHQVFPMRLPRPHLLTWLIDHVVMMMHHLWTLAIWLLVIIPVLFLLFLLRTWVIAMCRVFRADLIRNHFLVLLLGILHQLLLAQMLLWSLCRNWLDPRL